MVSVKERTFVNADRLVPVARPKTGPLAVISRHRVPILSGLGLLVGASAAAVYVMPDSAGARDYARAVYKQTALPQENLSGVERLTNGRFQITGRDGRTFYLELKRTSADARVAELLKTNSVSVPDVATSFTIDTGNKTVAYNVGKKRDTVRLPEGFKVDTATWANQLGQDAGRVVVRFGSGVVQGVVDQFSEGTWNK